MNPERTRRWNGRRAWIVGGVVVLAHLALFAAVGLVRPAFRGRSTDELADLNLELLPRLTPQGSEPVTAAARQARRDALAASPLARILVPPPPTPGSNTPSDPAAPSPLTAEADGGAGAAAGCEIEDLPLLTTEERKKCSNQIEVARARRAANLDDQDRAGRMAAIRQLPHVDAIAPGKRAYYDAVVAAQRAVEGDFTQPALVAAQKRHAPLAGQKSHADANVYAQCTLKFGPNKGKPAAPRFNLKLGAFDCPLAPPSGVGTEEARIAPP